MNKILSQEEINALLNETLDSGQESNPVENEQTEELDLVEKDALGEIANISMGSAATTLSSLLGKKVDITTPQIVITTIEKIREEYPQTYVTVDVNFTNGLEGANVFIIHTYDAGIIVDLMMGGDGSNPALELNEMHLSAISEAMNQMMGTSATSLSQILNKRIEISAPFLDVAKFQEKSVIGDSSSKVIKIAFHVAIEGLVESEMMQILPISFARSMVSELFKKNNLDDYQPEKKVEQDKKVKTNDSISDNHAVHTTAPMASPSHVDVFPAQFTTFQDETVSSKPQTNLDLLMDIGLQLSVELGRTNKKIREILELNKGSIIELDKLAGEPVDILINGKLLAQGEVVVIDENFGVRVTGIISPTERVQNLK